MLTGVITFRFVKCVSSKEFKERWLQIPLCSCLFVVFVVVLVFLEHALPVLELGVVLVVAVDADLEKK